MWSQVLEARASTRPLRDGGFAAALFARCLTDLFEGGGGMSSEGHPE